MTSTKLLFASVTTLLLAVATTGCTADPEPGDEPSSTDDVGDENVASTESAIQQTYVGWVSGYSTWCKSNIVTVSGGHYCSYAFQTRSTKSGCVSYTQMRNGSYANIWGTKSFSAASSWVTQIEDRRGC